MYIDNKGSFIFGDIKPCPVWTYLKSLGEKLPKNIVFKTSFYKEYYDKYYGNFGGWTFGKSMIERRNLWRRSEKDPPVTIYFVRKTDVGYPDDSVVVELEK